MSMANPVSVIDDVWNFGNASGAIPLSDSSGSSEDEKDTRPSKQIQKRRRRSEKAVVPELVILDESSEESDPDLQIVHQLQRRGEGKEEDPFMDLKMGIPRQAVKRLSSTAEAEASLKMKNSLMQIKRLRSQLENTVNESLEDEGNDGDNEQDYEKATKEDEDEATKSNATKVVVKIRWAQNEEPLKLRIGKNIPLQRLFDAFSRAGQQRKIFEPNTTLRFVFDGETLLPQQTAESLDIDDDCVIEAHW